MEHKKIEKMKNEKEEKIQTLQESSVAVVLIKIADMSQLKKEIPLKTIEKERLASIEVVIRNAVTFALLQSIIGVPDFKKINKRK